MSWAFLNDTMNLHQDLPPFRFESDFYSVYCDLSMIVSMTSKDRTLLSRDFCHLFDHFISVATVQRAFRTMTVAKMSNETSSINLGFEPGSSECWAGTLPLSSWTTTL